MTRIVIALVMLLLASTAQARDEQCLAAMHDHVQTCTDTCVAKARAAVDPSVQDRIVGRACAKNCLKTQMMQGRTCS